ncbi:hypothetical protein QUA43_23025 [Microcoleus sp. N9_B4]|uniref:hypothetical protein n=1 Tax=Microcoleus sp. N9_B4 TaxID=3055386 RepID=UPI002FD49148
MLHSQILARLKFENEAALPRRGQVPFNNSDTTGVDITEGLKEKTLPFIDQLCTKSACKDL